MYHESPSDSDVSQNDGQTALIRHAVDKLFTIATVADEVDAETSCAEALSKDIQPPDSEHDVALVHKRYASSGADDWLCSRLGLAIT